jgi:hypothetical protein
MANRLAKRTFAAATSAGWVAARRRTALTDFPKSPESSWAINPDSGARVSAAVSPVSQAVSRLLIVNVLYL